MDSRGAGAAAGAASSSASAAQAGVPRAFGGSGSVEFSGNTNSPGRVVKLLKDVPFVTCLERLVECLQSPSKFSASGIGPACAIIRSKIVELSTSPSKATHSVGFKLHLTDPAASSGVDVSVEVMGERGDSHRAGEGGPPAQARVVVSSSCRPDADQSTKKLVVKFADRL